MGQPAARVGDTTMHGVPLSGVGCPTVVIGGKPAWRVGDVHTCSIVNAPPPPMVPPAAGAPHGVGVVPFGSVTVIIGGQPAARMGDIVMEPLALGPTPMTPSNNIMAGEFTVLIG